MMTVRRRIYAAIGGNEFEQMRPEQNGLHFVDDTIKDILLKENNCVFNLRSLNSVPKGPINNKSVSHH